MELQREDYIAHLEKLFEWVKQNDYRSHDVCDVTANSLYIWLQKINNSIKTGKYIYFPFYYFSKHYPGFIRKSLGIEKRE